MFVRDHNLEFGCRIEVKDEKGESTSRLSAAGWRSGREQGSAQTRSVSVDPLEERSDTTAT